MAHIIQLKGGSSTLAASVNPVLHDREMGVETDTWQFKIGDGVTAWVDLPYGGLVGPQGAEGDNVYDGGTWDSIYTLEQTIDGGSL
jgi:hypothetical protein